MRAELTELVSRLVATGSVNRDLVPGCASELEVARFAAGGSTVQG